jgi:methionyl-tRNA formyltransferase
VAVIEEESPLAERARELFRRELPPSAHPPEVDELLEGRGIPRLAVERHNDPGCHRHLRRLALDLVVLGDTRILEPATLAIPREGTINVHPGWLPEVRGNNPYVWALVHDLPMGCSCHFLDESIDTGPLVRRRRLAVTRQHDFGRLLADVNRLCSELIVEVLERRRHGPLRRRPQPPVQAPTYTKAPPEVLAAAKAKLSAGTYRWLVPAGGR